MSGWRSVYRGLCLLSCLIWLVGCAGGPPAPSPTSAPAAATPAARQPEAAQKPPAQTSGSLVIASIANLPKTLHPYPNSADYSDEWTRISRYLWSGSLIDLDANTLEYVPYLASEWNVAADGKTFTFKLRDGLKWSDGQPLTVADFNFAWQNAIKEENDFVGLDDLKRIESFSTPDDRTIVVKLKETLARDVAIGVANGIGPVPKHVWDGKPWYDAAANPQVLAPTVTNGPYVLKSLTPDGATLERNPTWFKGQAQIERIVIRPGQQPTVAYELLKSNQAQWAPAVPPSQYTEAKQNPSLTMQEWTAANGAYRVVEFNVGNEFLKDKRVREAIARSINREDVIQVAENGLGQPQYTFLNPANVKWYSPDVEKYEFDLARSKQLLQDAGYKLDGGRLLAANGQQVKLRVTFPVSSNPRSKIAAYLQQQLKQLGIDVEVRGLEANAYFDEVKKKNFDLSLGTWGGGSIDPDLSSKGQLISDGQQNITSFKSEKVDELFRKGATEMDDAKRKVVYRDIQKVVNDELPTMYLYSLKTFTPMSKRVQGVQPNKLDQLDYNDALARWTLTQ
ncbi:MAG: ABC transporter substrate-binding protein [Chloroflexota bacterium]